jgi:DnaK suppressor protein
LADCIGLEAVQTTRARVQESTLASGAARILCSRGEAAGRLDRRQARAIRSGEDESVRAALAAQEMEMSESALDAEQRATLREVLLARRSEMVQEMESLHGGDSRVQHAREVLLQDADDVTQRDADREVDLARTDRLARAISAVDAALERIERDDYGHCGDCDAPIPFERLRANPQALRCFACETALEARRGGVRPRSSY